MTAGIWGAGDLRSGDRPQHGGGFLFDIPAKYTAEPRDVPTAEEVGPWIETIIRLWDDAEFCAAASRRARQQAARWSPERLAPIYRDFFNGVRQQPGPPIQWCLAAQKGP